MANIKDVARAAGVSVSTVSNILNGKVSVSGELHQKVVQAMQELDYHPNFLAMNLRKKKIGFIGVVVSSLLGHYHQILEGIYRVATENKIQPIVKVVNNASEERREIESLIQMSVSGIIVVSYNLNEALIAQYKNAGVPVVFADLYPKNSDCNIVRFDNYQMVHHLTNNLLLQGKTVGLITGSRFLGSEEDCVQGYLDAMDGNGQQQPSMFVTDFMKERAFSELMNFICGLEKMPDCFIVSVSHLAKTISEILSLLGIEGVSLVALSGDNWHSHREHSISYRPRSAIYCGVQAMNVLLENIQTAAAFDTKFITIEERNNLPMTFERKIQPNAETGEKKVLKLLLLKSNISNAIEMLSRNFTVETGIEVSVTAVSQLDLIRIIQDNAKSKSSQYDIIMADMHWLQQLKQENVFCKLNGLLNVEEILPRYVRDVRNYILSEADNENLYALPVLAGYQLLAYRSDLFDDALLQKKFYLQCGVHLTPPQTWNEFNLVAKFFTREFNRESPVAFGTCISGSKPQGIMAEFLPRQWSYNGQFMGRNGLDLVSIANLKAVKNLCETYRYSFPDCMDYLEDEQIQELLNGNVAMIPTYNVHLQDKLNASNQSIQFARMPGNVSLIGGWLLGINAYSKQVEESALFLEWEMSDRISVHSSLLGQISPFKNVFFDDELSAIYPWMGIIKEQYTSLRGKEFGTLNFKNDSLGYQLEEALAERLWQAMQGEIEPEAVLRLTQDQFYNELHKR